ncbi:digestive cysteine proteinase 2-like [Trichoplusia ni]|uniref:Digestive cysteine proteinase 2-like n=1 Tax=Trichoplusia ni TaxID=7111 RepID=A0A7E5WPY1_TRINI|nr:digestive cysteine proteinase 2-like [Trichoplusia ni]
MSLAVCPATMTLIWLLFGFAVVQAFSVESGLQAKKLEWADQFRLKAKRMSLTSNLVEDYAIWKTKRESRIDYNHGYVKSFVKLNRAHRFGVKYEIHPEATLDQDVYTVCNAMEGDKYDRYNAETILPEVDGFEAVGKEIVNDKKCTKFVYVKKDEKSDSKSTVWAVYVKKTKTWVPVRYEVLEFNSWLGSKEKHEVWDFYDYHTDFPKENVFSLDKFECNNATSHSRESETVTKHLAFIDPENDAHVDHVFKTFKNTHGRKYDDADEHAFRRSIFKNNMRLIVETNRQNLGYKLTINNFSDKTSDEMTKYMGLMRRPEGAVGTVPFPYTEKDVEDIVKDLPKDYDTRLLGYVTYVKNQEDCGSCWTFGTTAAVEGALARINGGRLMSLSNQALVDCTWAFGAGGCNGGTDIAAYDWMMEYGLPTEAEYGPYTNKDGICNIKNMTQTFPIRGYTNVSPLSIGALKVALVNHGPLSVSVHVTRAFGQYSSGIFYDTTCDETLLNHEVTLVGYGERDGDTFWILKNSWGPSWGLSGYMHISARDNVCGVATEPTYVVF